KGFSTEGGLKVPGIINFKNRIKGAQGQFDDQFVTVLDLAPTFLELADVKHPGSNYKGRDVHSYIGNSIMPYLSGETEEVHASDEVIAWELHNRIAVRKGDWKMIRIPGRFGTDDWELFNIKDDPAERVDLSTQFPDKRLELITAWEDYVVDNGVVYP
ncbi:MAG: hypothetical protein P8I94_12015, partial [Emcibacteraceae bacterium]|nr:hypothetical protein [Emcibacteraceae bacterium]